MPTAEVLTIGTELLLGEIQDTNTQYIARYLRNIGVDIYRATMIGDNEERIAAAVRESMGRCQILITTGGLGPTVDDPTRSAIARALGVANEFHEELWSQIQERFSHYGRTPSENNRRQAFMPAGAIGVQNPVGTAPSFICEVEGCSIIALPGVPREMEYLMENAVQPYLRQKFSLVGTIKARVLHVAGVGESTIDEWIGDLETRTNPSVGLLAHPGQVDIRITAKAESMEEADALIAAMESEVRERIPEGLYGADRETLEATLLQQIAERGWSTIFVECGLSNALVRRMGRFNVPAESVVVLDEACDLDSLRAQTLAARQERDTATALGVSLNQTTTGRADVYIVVVTPTEVIETMRSFGGERALAAPWAINNALEMLRRATA